MPYSVAADIDTWYPNRLDEGVLPSALQMALDDLQAQRKTRTSRWRRPGSTTGCPLSMYRTSVNSQQGGGVSWAYMLRNPLLALPVRKTTLGRVIAQARLGSECRWRRTPLDALNEVDLLVRRLWRLVSRRLFLASQHDLAPFEQLHSHRLLQCLSWCDGGL